MDGVLPQSTTGRPRVAAVGAILVLCLVGAPLMSLFPVGVWEAARALALSGAVQGVLLLAPVIVGVILVMIWLGTRWLEEGGVNPPAATAVLVTTTAMATPVLVAFLAPAFTPFPGGLIVNIALLTGAITTMGLGACMMLCRVPFSWRPGLLPALVVIPALLASLPTASDAMRARAADERSRAQIAGFEYTIAVLDHPGWTLEQVHEVNNGLRFTYRDGGGEPVHVLSWGGSNVLDPNGDGIHAGCDFPDVRCRDQNGWVLVIRRDDAPRELRTRLNDGAVVSLTAAPGSATDLTDLAPALRPEAPSERDRLAEAVTS